jgi:hypothetical protein
MSGNPTHGLNMRLISIARERSDLDALQQARGAEIDVQLIVVRVRLRPNFFRILSDTKRLKGTATIANGMAIVSSARTIRTNGFRSDRTRQLADGGGELTDSGMIS